MSNSASSVGAHGRGSAPGAAPKEDVLYPVLDGSRDLDKIADALQEWGVVVVSNVFTREECNDWMTRLVGSIDAVANHDPSDCTKRLSKPNLDLSSPDAVRKTWLSKNLPPQTRYGLFQNHLSQLPPAWEIRREPRVYQVFKAAHLGLERFRSDECKVYGNKLKQGDRSDENAGDVDKNFNPNFVCSMDGVNVQPNHLSHELRTKGVQKDWAHLDQTRRDNPFLCVQGQVVLTQTEASFRCTPRSHRRFNEIMDVCGVGQKDNSNWLKFGPEQVAEVQKLFPDQDRYQVPIYADQGSMILWLSTTIHSARGATHVKQPTPEDQWAGWRGVVYVCHRPIEQFDAKGIERLNDILEKNCGTPHWANKKMPNWRFGVSSSSESIKAVHANPTKVYEILQWRPPKDYFLIKAKEIMAGRNALDTGVHTGVDAGAPEEERKRGRWNGKRKEGENGEGGEKREQDRPCKSQRTGPA